MTTLRISTFDAHPETVFGALLDAAEALETTAQIIDAKSRQAVIGKEGKSYRVSASVTDNGWGQTTLHLSWTHQGSAAARKCARRLSALTGRSLDGMVSPPPSAPPPTGQ